MPISDQQLGELISDIKWMKQKFKHLDDIYSKKWVETAVSRSIGFIIFAVLGALLGLVIIRPSLAAIIETIS